MTTRTTIVEKIKRVRALTASPNVHEAAAAAGIAERLMRGHDVSEERLEAQPTAYFVRRPRLGRRKRLYIVPIDRMTLGERMEILRQLQDEPSLQREMKCLRRQRGKSILHEEVASMFDPYTPAGLRLAGVSVEEQVEALKLPPPDVFYEVIGWTGTGFRPFRRDSEGRSISEWQDWIPGTPWSCPRGTEPGLRPPWTGSRSDHVQVEEGANGTGGVERRGTLWWAR